jgi:hypothetical protein
VVQMAKSQYDGLEYAIKFFISRVAFNAELAMYDSRGDTQGSSLAQFLPKVCSRQPSCTTSDTYHHAHRVVNGDANLVYLSLSR